MPASGKAGLVWHLSPDPLYSRLSAAAIADSRRQSRRETPLSRTPAFRAFDTNHVELSDQIAEDDRAVGHFADTCLTRGGRSRPSRGQPVTGTV
jgi:hypothetical protein